MLTRRHIRIKVMQEPKTSEFEKPPTAWKGSH